MPHHAAMKSIAIVLASGVVAGLAVYAILDWQGWIGLMVTDMVTMRVGTCVGATAAVGFGSAALALVFRRGFDRTDRREYAELEARIAKLEATRSQLPGATDERAV